MAVSRWFATPPSSAPRTNVKHSTGSFPFGLVALINQFTFIPPKRKPMKRYSEFFEGGHLTPQSRLTGHRVPVKQVSEGHLESLETSGVICAMENSDLSSGPTVSLRVAMMPVPGGLHNIAHIYIAWRPV